MIRVRIDGEDKRIYRLGRWDDPVAVARAQSIADEIWSDIQRGELDPSLSRYRPQVEEEESDLLRALKNLMESKRQTRVTHTYRTVQRFGRSIRTGTEAEGFVVWMTQQNLAASTQSTILSTIRSVQPRNKALQAVRVKVPARRVQEEVLSKAEIQAVLEDLKAHEPWFYPVFAVWLGTGLRNAELIGLSWDAVRLEEGELLIHKTLKRDGTATHRRSWSTTKTGHARVVPLRDDLVLLLQEHQRQMKLLGLDVQKGLVFVTPRTHRHLYDSGLEKVWKRSQQRVGLTLRRLYAQRHSFLSHALAMGNSPADLAAVAGHRTEELLKTYAKPTGKVVIPNWS